jgi:hypothetical protein
MTAFAYYKDHLPLLGEAIRTGGSLAGTSTLAVGDQVSITIFIE